LTRLMMTPPPVAYLALGVVAWLALSAAGVHATLAGAAVALAVPVRAPRHRDAEAAYRFSGAFRESPDEMYARAAAKSLRAAVPIDERLHAACSPVVSYLILPAFALANAGVTIDGSTVPEALSSTLTWGVILGLVAGKFAGVFGAAVVLRAIVPGAFGAGISLDRIAGGAALCGIGFTIALYVAGIVIDDPAALNQARLGVIAASLVAAALGFVLFRLGDRFHRRRDDDVLVRPVDPGRDHIAGPIDAPITIVEYGDFRCEFCLKASGVVAEVRAQLGDGVRYVWRHSLPHGTHVAAVGAAKASEAAAAQGRFFDFAHALFADQEHQSPSDLDRHARDLGLDVTRFDDDLASDRTAERVQEDVLDAESMDIRTSPAFFINGVRYRGPHDADPLIRALTNVTIGLPNG
jgi:protein-disulfide isomerase